MTDSADQKPLGFSHRLEIYAHAKSLNYCCPAVFLALHPREENELIALRFGCSERVVRKWRALPFKCERSESCLLPRCTHRLSLEQLKALTASSAPPCSAAPEPSTPADPPTPT